SLLLVPVPPPPSPPLFPYTTLFRSPAEALGQLCEQGGAERVGSGEERIAHPEVDRVPGGAVVVAHGDELLHQPQVPVVVLIGRADRKSTRLNSSHVSISYAVFCLKK